MQLIFDMVFKDILSLFNNNTVSFLLISIILTLIVWDKNLSDIPIPTEIIERKKNRKKFKQDRKDWMASIHKTEPGIDWKKIDQTTREQKFLSKNSIRKELNRRELQRNPLKI